MAKADNDRITATDEQRAHADLITRARKHMAEWKTVADDARDNLLGTLKKHDVTLVTATGDEVASITDSEPSQGIDWKAFHEDHPEIDVTPYLKPAKVTTTVTTKWVEQKQKVKG